MQLNNSNNNIYLVKEMYPSPAKKVFLEFMFVGMMALWVVVTLVDIPIGAVLLIIARMSGNNNYQPWLTVKEVWRQILRHLSYLLRLVLSPAYRKTVKASKQKIIKSHERLKNAIDEVEFTDVAIFFAYLPHILGVTAFVVHSVIAVAIVISLSGVYYTSKVTPLNQPYVEPRVEYQPQDVDIQERDYGPWFNRSEVLDRVNNSDFKNIVLLSDTGLIKYSKNKVAVRNGFAVIVAHERIINPQLTANGQITFRDQENNRFSLNPGQAFMFENYIDKVYMFDDKGQIMANDLKNLQIMEVK